jgi:DNA-binding PadR family transcriptional regulator
MAYRPDQLSLAVLALLCEQPRHPYEMQRTIWERHGAIAPGMPRSLYHAVDRMVRAGLVEPAETSREGNRPERTVYRITETGREELTTHVSDRLKAPGAAPPELAFVMGLVAYLDSTAVVEALERRVVALEAEVAGLEAGRHALQERVRLPRVSLLGAECRQALKQAELEWVRGLIDDIGAGRLYWDFASLGRHFQAAREARGLKQEEEGT